MALIPERLIDFRCYVDGSAESINVVSVTLPDVTYTSDEIRGAGIGGSYSSPTIGHFDSMQATLNFRAIDASFIPMLRLGSHRYELRGAVQTSDPATGRVFSQSLVVNLVGSTTAFSSGAFDAGASQEVTITVEVTRIDVYSDNTHLITIDKKNAAFVVGGVDQMAQVKAQIM